VARRRLVRGTDRDLPLTTPQSDYNVHRFISYSHANNALLAPGQSFIDIAIYLYSLMVATQYYFTAFWPSYVDFGPNFNGMMPALLPSYFESLVTISIT